MTLVIPPGFGLAQFVLTGPAGTQPYVTTLGVDLSAAGGDFVVAANSAKSAYASTIGTTTSSALTLDRVTLSVGQDGPGGSVDSNTPPTTFTRTGSFPPTAMSAIARKVTNDLGRRGRGRMFIPGVLSENEVDEDGTVVAARRTALNTTMGSFFAALVEAGAGEVALEPVLLHSSAPTDPTPITAFAVSDLVGWIRGRIR